MKLVTAEEMRNLDNAAIHTFHIPSLELMENAGCRTVEVMLDRYGDPLGKTVSIFVGPGNNGGDGFVVAEMAQRDGLAVQVLLLCDEQRIKGDALTATIFIFPKQGIAQRKLPGSIVKPELTISFIVSAWARAR